MKEDMLQQLIEKTFSNLACPAQGKGMYAEIQKAILAAYDLGKKTEKPARKRRQLEYQ